MEEKVHSWPSQTDSNAPKGQALTKSLGNEKNSKDPRLLASRKQENSKKPCVNLTKINSNDDEQTIECIRNARTEESKT